MTINTTIARVRLAELPTPLTDAVRLRDALGGPSKAPRILIKRDDLTGLGLGGNKARKLEFLIADAQARGAHTVITTGAVQSNHARMTAAAARMPGLKPVLVLTAKDDHPAVEGNLLLDYLYGADVRFVPAIDPMFAVGHDEAVVQEVVEEETRAGARGLRHSRRWLERRRCAGLCLRDNRARRSAPRARRGAHRACTTRAARAAHRPA